MDLTDKILVEFGLTENEAKVYRAALKHGETGPFELARETGIPRTTVYELLTGLALKGLVEIKKSEGLMKQQTKIRAKNPSILREIIAKRRQELTSLEVDVVQVLPELKGEYLRHVPSTDFQFYPGVEGAKKVYELMNTVDMAEPTVTWDCLMPMDAFGSELMNKWVDISNTNLNKPRRNLRSLIPLNDWTKHVVSYQFERDSRYLNRQFRFVDAGGFNIYQDIHVQGKNTYIVNGMKEEAWGLVMHSELLAKSFKAMFEVMWVGARTVDTELVKSWGENPYFTEEKRRKKKLG